MSNKRFSNLFLFLFLIFLAACGSKSIMHEDPNAGLNGSFEILQAKLPVNWMFYTQDITDEGDFEVTTDVDDFKHGRRSVRFDITSCSDEGGWKSPGLAKEMDAKTRTNYKLSMWVKNEGTNFRIRFGAVTIAEAFYTDVADQSSIGKGWQLIEHEYYLTDDNDRLRLEVNITSPGKFWIDGVSITEN